MTALLDWVDRGGDHGLHVADREGWTAHPYDGLARSARSVAAGLTARGVRRCDVVVIVQRSGPEFVATFFGALLAGATPAPVAPRAPFRTGPGYDEHLAGLLRVARPALVVTDRDLAPGVAAVAAACGTGCAGVDELAAPATAAPRRGGRAEVALLQFTSGSSGRPRGVCVPFEALEANITAIRSWLHWGPDDACASWLPVHHDMGLVGCLLTSVVTGSDLWLMQPEQFVGRPERYLRCFDAGGARVTAMPGFGVAHLLRRLHPERLAGVDLSGWRSAVVGAERVDPDLLDRCERALAPFGLRRGAFRPAYGLAEATLAVTGVPVGRERTTFAADPRSLSPGERVRPAADGRSDLLAGCGSPLGGARVSVAGDDGTPVPDGTVGEIVVRGDAVASGIVTGPDASPSATTLRDGVLRTGDAGFLLDGELYVIGRRGDALKVRGRSVYAEALEAELGRAGLPERRLAVALGVRGGRPTAVAMLEQHRPGDPATVRRVLAAATGADVEVILGGHGSVPRTTSGKPRRGILWNRVTGAAAASADIPE